MKIIGVINWIKSNWQKLLIIILILATGAFYGLYQIYHGKFQSQQQRANRWKENYDQQTIKHEKTKDELGRTERRVRELKITTEELQSVKYEQNQRIQKLLDELEYSNVKIEDLEETLITEMESKNKGTTVIRDTIIQQPPDKAHHYLHVQDTFMDFRAWWLEMSNVNWEYQYNETIYYWTELKPTIYNKNGNKRFFLWRWIWPDKKPVTKVKSTNPNSEINARKIKIKE
jgi:hypothetical protein